MADDWNRAEVEAAVADYFDMLNLELRGLSYNKTEHRRRLARLLNRRTGGAIERNHQNISAVLIELGFVYIPGYKPLCNYQQLLFEVVSDHLDDGRSLIKFVQAQVAEPATLPVFDDILASMVPPPSPDPEAQGYRFNHVRERPVPRMRVNYLAIEARNRSLGAAGEEFVERFETASLLQAGQDRLACRV
jgi:hypothetical protein